MKFFNLLTAFLVITHSANAVVRPGWERPILKAQMVEFFDQSGHEFPFRNTEITLNKRDESRSPTTILVKEDLQRYCVTTPCPQPRTSTLYHIIRTYKDDCGTTVYRAIPFSLTRNIRLAPPANTLVLQDHITRLCEDYRKYRWEATLLTNDQKARLLAGNPEPVYTPASGR